MTNPKTIGLPRPIIQQLHGKLLLLEDYALDAKLIEHNIRHTFPDLSIYRVSNKEDFVRLLAELTPNVVLIDYHIPSLTGIEALQLVQSFHPETACIMLSGSFDEKNIGLCIENNVFDWIQKDNLTRLNLTIANALKLSAARAESQERLTESLVSKNRLKALFKKSGLAIVELNMPGLGMLVSEMSAPHMHRAGIQTRLEDILHRLTAVQTSEASQRLFDIDSEGDFLHFFSLWMKSGEVPLVSMLTECLINRHQSIESELVIRIGQDKKHLNLRLTYDHKLDHFAIGIIDLSAEKISLEKAEMLMNELEHRISERTEDLNKINATLQQEAVQRKRVTAALRDNYLSMTDSIIAAKSIQQLMLPSKRALSESFAKHFIYYQPKDIVSGDFYWFFKHGSRCWLAVADCVGHGVPGAFMSMISAKILNQIVVENQVHDAAEILSHLDDYVCKEMRQHERSTQVSTGMDITICSFDYATHTLQFAGAHHNLLAWRDDELKIYKGNRISIGGRHTQNKLFKDHVISFKPGDRFYLSTDGIPDQFGGDKNKKFGKRRLQNLVQDMQSLTLNEQEYEIREAVLDWKQSEEQVDDMLLIGIEI